MTETINNANAAASTLFLGHNGEWWDFWLIVSVIVAALAATAIGVTTAGSIVSHKREAIAGESAFGRYKLETGKLIAEATARQKEAELKLEELRVKTGPRQIDGETFKKSLEGKPKPNAAVEIMFPREDGEAFRLAIQLRDVLKYSGWKASEPSPVPPGDIPRLQDQPSVASYGSYGGTGIVVVTRADSQADFDALGDINANTPLNALVGALTKTLGSAGAAAAGPNVFHVPALGVLRVVIGTKA